MKLDSLSTDLLRSAAPTLLASLALPPPFNRIASGVATSSLQNFAPPAKKRALQAGQKPAPMTPDEVVRAVDEHATDPEFVLALHQAEADLRKYELDAGIRFRELELQDRTRAGEIQTATGLGETAFRYGMYLVWIALSGIIVMVLALLAIVSGIVSIEENEVSGQLAVAAFGLIGTAVGFVNGIAGTVVAFYWGSSQGSKEKAEAISGSMDRWASEFARSAEARAAPREEPRLLPPPEQEPTPAQAEAADEAAKDVDVSEPATPAGFGLDEVLPDLSKPHRHFPGSVRWSVVPDGISVEGSDAGRTHGNPKTVTDIWSRYGDYCSRWAKIYGVPVELIVATIATESGGNQNARRAEPRIKDESVGLMQTLVKTAREALGRKSLVGDDLLDPDLSIRAGTAYIASQRHQTSFDPVLVGAAYNAGSLRPDEADANRWKIHCFPKGTGKHIDRFISWFGDAMRVSAAGNWGADGVVPSFAFALRGASPAPEAAARTAPAAAAAAEARAIASLLAQVRQPMPLATMRGTAELVKEIQDRLIHHGYLDPPPDGDFGQISTWAFEAYCKQCGIAVSDEITVQMAQSLLSTEGELPALPKRGDWVDTVVDHMLEQGYWLSRFPGCMNIVYLEGLNPDGTLNDDRTNVFNDLRAVVWIDGNGRLEMKAWEATTEPSKFWVENPMVQEGAARIGFGQYKSWVVGTHRAGSKSAHEALVQVRPVSVHRDLNQDHLRTNDKVFTGNFGINQHWGYDNPREDIGKASAGCLVGRTVEGHKEFMRLVKSDPRYKINPAYRFLTTVLPADKVFAR